MSKSLFLAILALVLSLGFPSFSLGGRPSVVDGGVPPDPVISGGCLAGGNPPCNFTATSASGASMAGWTFAWTVSGGTYSAASHSGPTFSPTFTQSATFTVSLIATNEISAAAATPVQVQAVASSLCPDMVPGTNIFLRFSGTGCNENGGTCAPGQSIVFNVGSFLNYSMSCANHTFLWTISGQQYTTQQVPNTTLPSGSHPVSVVVSNGKETKTLTATVNVGTGTEGAGCFSPTFVQLASVPAEHDVSEFAAGDVNNDGHTDLVTVSFAGGDIKVMFGSGDGTFGLALSYPSPAPQDVALGDVDNDGFLDIIVSNEPPHTEECVSFGSCAGFSVLLNDGDGSYGEATTIPVPFAASVVAVDVADFNSDGKQDFLVAAPPLPLWDASIHVFLGDGTGAPGQRRSWAPDGPVTDAVAARLNGPQTEPDVVVAVGPSGSSTYTRILAFASQSAAFPSVSASRNIAEGSWDARMSIGKNTGPGTLDIGLTFRMLAQGTPIWGAAAVRASSSTSIGSLTYFALSGPPLTDAVAVDLDEDGDLDVMTTTGSNGWTAFRRNGASFYTSTQDAIRQGNFSPLATATRVVMNDFNHDGRSDLLFLDTLNDAVIVLRNTCSARYVTVSLSSSPNPSTLAGDATFTIHVEDPPDGPPVSGEVTLRQGATVLGSAPLDAGGNAHIVLSDLPLGTHSLHATFDTTVSPTYSHTVGPAPFGPPLAVSAIGNGAANEITVRWIGTSDVASHEVLRRTNGEWVLVAQNISGLSYIDSNVVPSSAYVYAVRSVRTNGERSALSNSDIGTTATLALPGDFRIRATDFVSTLSLVNSLRLASGLPEFSFTENVAAGMLVKASHMSELRDAVNQSRVALGFAPLVFTNSTLTPQVTPIRRIDITEIRTSFN